MEQQKSGKPDLFGSMMSAVQPKAKVDQRIVKTPLDATPPGKPERPKKQEK